MNAAPAQVCSSLVLVAGLRQVLSGMPCAKSLGYEWHLIYLDLIGRGLLKQYRVEKICLSVTNAFGLTFESFDIFHSSNLKAQQTQQSSHFSQTHSDSFCESLHWQVKEEEEFNFMYIDFVEGGCSDLFPEERRCIDVDELNKEAEQYFVLLKGLIAFDIECALNHHVYAFLSGQLLDDMEQKMRTKIHEIAFKDGGSKISEMVGGEGPCFV
jgi:hypothetical protein